MNQSDNSLTVIMPAYNEATKIAGAYETATRAIRRAGIEDYEIVMVTNTAPDGSHDGTPDIADGIAANDSHVRHIFHRAYVGLGFKYREAVRQATKKYVTWMPGADHILEDSFFEVLKHIGEAPILVIYTKNPEARPMYMRIVSKGFVILYNLAFGLHLRYYNGINVLPRELLRIVPMSADNPSFMAEILIYLLKSGTRYIQLPQVIKVEHIPGKTFRLKSIMEVLGTFFSLWWKIRIKRVRLPIPAEFA